MLETRTYPAKATQFVLILLALGSSPAFGAAKPRPSMDRLQGLPVVFEKNRGQALESADFLGRAKGYTASISATGLVLAQSADDASAPIHLRWVGADSQARSRARNPLPGHTNYFSGNDPAQWRTTIPHYATVEYERIYPGVDIVYYGSQGYLEYDFRLAAHADAKMIRLRYHTADHVDVDEHGDLVIQLGGQVLRQKKPTVYQEIEGARREIGAAYTLLENGEVGFDLDVYDASRPLVIDPVVQYSTFLGGSQAEDDASIVVDAAGNTYVVGKGASDTVVFKLNPTATAVLYLTVLSGIATEETSCHGSALAVDAAGNAYVTGETNSNNFPTTQGAYNRQRRGGIDLFVVKLNPAGAIAYSTFLGGAGNDGDPCIALGPQDTVYIAAETTSTDFPTTDGAYDRTFEALVDITVSKLRLAGQGSADLLYSTYVGGACNDRDPSIVVDSLGVAYVVGETGLPATFPITPGAFDPSHNGEIDLFVFKLDPAGRGAQDLVYSTYFGGSGTESVDGNGRAIAIDVLGDIYITGETDSQNVPIPLTAGAFDTTFNGEIDLFIAKLRLGGQGASDLVFSTLLGGSGLDENSGIVVDEARLIYFTGDTDSQTIPFPTVKATQGNYGGGLSDVVMGVLSPDGSQLLFSSYLGATGFDCCPDLFVDNSGRLHIVGETSSANFPTTAGVLDTTYGGQNDFFVTRLGELGVRMFTVSNASGARPELAPETIASGFGLGLADQVLPVSAAKSGPVGLATTGASIDLPTSLGGVSVRVTDSQGQVRLAQLFFVSPGQINYLVPAGTAQGWAWVEVVKNNVVVARDGIRIAKVSPGIYTANLSGSGVPLAITLRYPASGPVTQQFVFNPNTAVGSRVPVPINLGPATDQVFLILYGTGLRGATAATATIGGLGVPVAGPVGLAEFVGLDQANLGPLPRALLGRGQVEVQFTVDGRPANTVVVNIQ